MSNPHRTIPTRLQRAREFAAHVLFNGSAYGHGQHLRRSELRAIAEGDLRHAHLDKLTAVSGHPCGDCKLWLYLVD